MANNVLRWKGKTIHEWLVSAEDWLARARYATANGGYGPYTNRMCDEAIKALRGAKRTNRAPKGQKEEFRAGRMSSGGKRRHAKAAHKSSHLGRLTTDINRLVKG